MFVLQKGKDMNIPEILDFLKRLSENNTREWFQEHKNEYQNAQSSFENLLADIIARISLFDESISHVRPHDCTYRIYRDVRFSADKSPYKNHIGGYINARGKNRTTADITYICNLATVCWQEEAGVCRPICLKLSGSRL